MARASLPAFRNGTFALAYLFAGDTISAMLTFSPVPPEVRASIEALHQTIARQFVTKQYDRMSALMMDRFTPEFVWKKSDGREENLISQADHAEWELKNVDLGRSDGPLKYAMRLGNWKRMGDRITVETASDVVGEWLQGTYRMPVVFKSLMRETWVLRGGEWKALRFDEIWVKGKMDGKPFSAKG
ncbi:hypothetical protein EON81_05520 [bacterium]|nr:MAG: hypothetical protein EON81_05520 [bacterium]